MSDSLRDQLLNAGFAEPKAKPAQARKTKPRHKPKKPSATPSNSVQATVSTPVQREPKAGHTHVPTAVPRKKKSKKAPVIKPRTGSWSTRDHSQSDSATAPANDPAAAERRRQAKAAKAAIQAIIESAAIKEYQGETVYRFTLQKKIRELMVSETVRQQLVNAELAITKLNGATCIVPAATVSDIRAHNPQWFVFLTSDTDSASDEDEEYPIPDDLIW